MIPKGFRTHQTRLVRWNGRPPNFPYIHADRAAVSSSGCLHYLYIKIWKIKKERKKKKRGEKDAARRYGDRAASASPAARAAEAAAEPPSFLCAARAPKKTQSQLSFKRVYRWRTPAPRSEKRPKSIDGSRAVRYGPPASVHEHVSLAEKQVFEVGRSVVCAAAVAACWLAKPSG